jgi:phytoene desaturase
MTQTIAPSRAVVIGSGFGGLSAAIRLRAMGYEVTVLEALDQPGGRARVFKDQGFTFDAGPTVVTAPYLFDELFELVGRRREDYVEFLPVDPFYRVEFDPSQGGGHFDYVGEEERILEQIRKFNPADVDGYLKMVDHMRRIFEVGYMQLADVPFGKFSDMMRVVPDMMKLENYRTVYGLTSKYIKDERLRQVFTFQPLLIGGNPFQTTSIYSMIHWLERKWGVYFAKGGTTSIVHALVRLLDELGVPVVCNAPVKTIEVDGGKAKAVVTEDGKRYVADIVVSNADPSMVYKHMIAPQHRKKHTDAQVDRVKGSMGLFVAYFGTTKQFPDIKHHTIVLGPRYKPLLNDIFNKKVLADDFSLYLHRPTATDPSLAPAGKDAWYVLSPVPNLDGGQDWEKLAPAYLDKIIKSLDRLAPGLSSSVTATRYIDPRHFRDEYRTAKGTAFGPEPVLTQSAWFRYHNASPDVGGLYFVGAGTHPGAGMPGVLCSSKVLEKVVVRPENASPLPERPASATRKAA